MSSQSSQRLYVLCVNVAVRVTFAEPIAAACPIPHSRQQVERDSRDNPGNHIPQYKTSTHPCPVSQAIRSQSVRRRPRNQHHNGSQANDACRQREGQQVHHDAWQCTQISGNYDESHIVPTSSPNIRGLHPHCATLRAEQHRDFLVDVTALRSVRFLYSWRLLFGPQTFTHKQSQR